MNDHKIFPTSNPLPCVLWLSSPILFGLWEKTNDLLRKEAQEKTEGTAGAADSSTLV